MKRLIALALTLVFSPIVAADETARLIAFDEGRYSEAMLSAEAEGAPDALAFAARCALAEAMSAPDHVPPQDIVEQAEDLARRAVEIAPDHVEGRLQLAIALSLRSRPLSTREAMRAGYGSEAKELATAVLEDDPENAYANGFLAVWHVEVVRRGGSIGSSVMGASIKKARKHYAAAIEQDPADASTHWQYAKALAAHNAKKYRSEIDTALDAAASAQAETELERVMQARAFVLKDALSTLPRKQVEALAEEML